MSPQLSPYDLKRVRMWLRGFKAYQQGKGYDCRCKDDRFLEAWHKGWLAAKRRAEAQQKGPA